MIARRRPALLLCLLAFLLVGQIPGARAFDRSDFSFSGFLTLGAVASDRDDVWFTRYGVNHPGQQTPDFSADTLLGLQGSWRTSTQNDLTLQVVTMEDGTGEVEPRVTLAFFRQTLAPGLSMRVGRLRVPFFMLSDSLFVNYANPWVRQPVEVYSLNAFNDLDGIDLLYHGRLGEFDIEVHPYFGSGGFPFPDGEARLRNARGLNLVLSHGALSLHLGHGEGRFTFERGDAQFRALSAVLRAIGRSEVIGDMSGKNGRAEFDSVGVQWDDGDWLFFGEYARRRANRYVGSAHGWYLTLGRRLGTVTPYVTFARQRLDEPFSDAQMPDLPSGPAPDDPRLPEIRLPEIWQAFLTSRNQAQRSLSLGARWDFRRDAALKVELSRARPDKDAWGSYFPRENPLTTQIGGKRIDTLSLSLDVAF